MPIIAWLVSKSLRGKVNIEIKKTTKGFNNLMTHYLNTRFGHYEK